MDSLPPQPPAIIRTIDVKAEEAGAENVLRVAIQLAEYQSRFNEIKTLLNQIKYPDIPTPEVTIDLNDPLQSQKFALNSLIDQVINAVRNPMNKQPEFLLNRNSLLNQVSRLQNLKLGILKAKSIEEIKALVENSGLQFNQN